MPDLTTTYMGLELKNPLLVSSCGLTKTLDGILQCAEAGPGAIVLKSLFEEQIEAETAALMESAQGTDHTEAAEYLQGYGQAFGPQEYLQLIQRAKQKTDIPIIASINCVTAERWVEYAKKLEFAGADALEVNVSFLPNDPTVHGAEVEDRYEKILAAVKGQAALPVALKVGPYFSSFAHLAGRLGNDRFKRSGFSVGWCGPGEVDKKVSWRGADALVLFNRFYRFDIDLDRLKLAGANPYSTSEELHTPLRWISLLAGRIQCDLAANTGIHTGSDVVKQLLAGATVVQLCSTLYRNGLEQIALIQNFLQEWMGDHGFEKLADFRGRLSQAKSETPEDYERLQYIKALVGIE